MAVTHIAFDLRLGNQGATESMTMTSRAPDRMSMSAISSACSPLSGCETIRGIGVDTQMPGIDRIQRVLGIDECRHPAVLLCVGDHM